MWLLSRRKSLPPTPAPRRCALRLPPARFSLEPFEPRVVLSGTCHAAPWPAAPSVVPEPGPGPVPDCSEASPPEEQTRIDEAMPLPPPAVPGPAPSDAPAEGTGLPLETPIVLSSPVPGPSATLAAGTREAVCDACFAAEDAPVSLPLSAPGIAVADTAWSAVGALAATTWLFGSTWERSARTPVLRRRRPVLAR
jgi:hypothetical protein